MTYRIRQMLELDLLRRTRRVARAGRPIQYYRSTADSVFAPMRLTSVATLRELFRRSRTDLEQELETGGERAWMRMGGTRSWGTHLYRPSPESSVNRDFVPEAMLAEGGFWAAVLAEASPPVWDQRASLSLSASAAKRLQRELAAIVARYAGEGAAGAHGSRTYLVHLAMAPQDAG